MSDPPREAISDPSEPALDRAPLGLGLKLGYGVGDLAMALSYGAINVFLLFYLVEVAGVRPALAGVVLLSGRALDAITDPVMGMVSDRTRSRWGRRRPYLLFGAGHGGVRRRAGEPGLGARGRQRHDPLRRLLLRGRHGHGRAHALSMGDAARRYVEGAASQSRTAITGIHVMLGGATVVLIAVAVVIVLRYPITESSHRAARGELERRRALVDGSLDGTTGGR